MTETQTVSAVMGLPEWTVLAVISEQPTYGFAVAQLTTPDGSLAGSGRSPGQSSTGRLAD